MKHSILLAASLSLVAAVGAQEPTATFDPVSDAWVRFQQQNGPQWTADWNKATGTPKAVYGTGLRVKTSAVRDLNEARVLAGGLLAAEADLLGTGVSTFGESIASKVGQLYILVYDQAYQGLPVIGGRADVRLHESGVVSMFGSQSVQVPAGFDIAPQIGERAALLAAATKAGVDVKAIDGSELQLVIHADVQGRAVTTPRLAWQVEVDVRVEGAEPIVGTAWVDARSGLILGYQNRVYSCWMGHTHIRGENDGSGHADAPRPAAAPAPITGNVSSWLNRASPVDPLVNSPLQGLRVTAAGVGSAFTDANGDFTIPYSGTNPVNVSVNFASGSGQFLSGGLSLASGSPVSATVSATPGTPVQIQLLAPSAGETSWSQPTVFWHVDDVYRWLTGLTGAFPTNRFNIANMRAQVNISSTCNAYYTGNTINFYNRGGSCNMTGFSSVIYHEWGHGIDDAFGGISQTDGLSEAWGDIMSIYRMADPIVGRNFTTSGGFVRSALNTKTYPAGGFPSGGAPHPKGEVFMGWAWQVRNGMIAKLGQAAGAARAEQIVAASIAADATNQPDAVLEVFLLDDDDGNLANGTPNYDVLEPACLSRNLPFPEVQVGTVTHTPLRTFRDRLRPRVVDVDITALSGAFSTTRVAYNDGSGLQFSDLVATGNGAQHVAALPGIDVGQTVRYYVEAVHSAGRTFRLPEAGFYTYTVGSDVILYEDGFENGANGWTNGLVSRQNDWQQGAPTGRSGSDQGVAWRDPSVAATGTSCWGNDLGIGNFNGAYQPNVENWLRSPSIDCSGQAGVKLRFKRWLTVEESQYDRAEIRVNNQVVWVNPVSGNLIDTGWTDFELDIPSADGNPAVQIEWRLITDGGLNLGGWAIDDVQVVVAGSLPDVDMTYTANPVQVGLGNSTTLSAAGVAGAPAAFLFSPVEGPIQLPGLPDLYVGNPFVPVTVQLDGNGDGSLSVPVPNNPSLTGGVVFTQAVQINGGQLEASNKNLFVIGG